MWEHFLLLLLDQGSSVCSHFLLGTSNGCTNTAGKTVFQRAALGSGSFQSDRKKQQTQGCLSRSWRQGLCLAESLAEGAGAESSFAPRALLPPGFLGCFRELGFGGRSGGQDVEAQLDHSTCGLLPGGGSLPLSL